MTRTRLAVLVLIAAPLALVCSLTLRADPPRNAAQNEDLFAGKILLVTQRTGNGVAAPLEEVHLTRLGDQTYLVGKGFDDSKGWLNGRTIWVPAAEINQIVEFTDRTDLIKSAESRTNPGR